MIVSLSGYAQVGKSTAAQILTELQPHKRWVIKSFADKLREVASVMTGVPEGMFKEQYFKSKQLAGWDMTAREFLQKLGTDAIRNNLHKDAWVNALMSDYQEGMNWVIDDCRFPNEASIISQFGGKIIRINRPGYGPLNNHPSETALDDWWFDVEINNAGDKDFFKQQIQSILNL